MGFLYDIPGIRSPKPGDYDLEVLEGPYWVHVAYSSRIPYLKSKMKKHRDEEGTDSIKSYRIVDEKDKVYFEYSFQVGEPGSKRNKAAEL